MKRAKTSLEDIASWDNLASATCRAARGKRRHPEVRDFLANLEHNLAALRRGILTGGVEVGRSVRFHIRDPKPRVIHAPCFRERVLHHAVMRQIGPVLERALVDDTFACRVGKGTFAAVRRAQHHARRFAWYAKMDVRGYFAHIDHAVLKDRLARKFRSGPVLALLGRIVDAHADGPGRGLPIGALTSQCFANFYLDPLDRHLLETCRVAGLVRYMDDVVVWGRSRAEVADAAEAAQAFSAAALRLELKQPAQVNTSLTGLTICGYRVFPGTVRLALSRRRRYRRRQAAWERAWLAGRIDERQFQRGCDAVHAIVLQADSRQWLRGFSRRRPAWYDDL